MRFWVILVFSFALGITGCGGEKDQPPADEAQTTAPEEPAVSTTEDELWHSESLVEHMHLHAEKLDELNFALADGDLEAARVSARWLSTHDTDAGIKSDWAPFLYRMRLDAEAVAAAPDIETAQAAAERITAQCQECHNAVGVRPQ